MRSFLSIAPQRWLMLVSGFLFWGLGLSLFVRANLGLGPWDAFHQGLGFQLGITIGTASIIASVIVLLFWIPLRQRPGIGTILNALTIGPFTDLGLWLLPHEIESLWLRGAMLVAGMACVGLGSALYLPAGLGAGPRDGLMMGLHDKLGWSIRLSRTAVEACALAIGWLMGGTVGVGTLVFAFGIGPLVQASLAQARRFLPDWRLPAPAPARR
ncbi:MAG: hypothetical protein R3D05_02970 [Dongiaceae bacterium]